jgi:hypothetical protein
MGYRVYHVHIRKEDREKGDEIILRHWYNGDIDTIAVNTNCDGSIIYCVSPYVYDNLETILRQY